MSAPIVSKEDELRVLALSKKYRLKFAFSLGSPIISRRDPGTTFACDALSYELLLNGRRIGEIWGEIPGTARDEGSLRVTTFAVDDDEDDNDSSSEMIANRDPTKPFESDPNKVEVPEEFIVWVNLPSAPDGEKPYRQRLQDCGRSFESIHISDHGHLLQPQIVSNEEIR